MKENEFRRVLIEYRYVHGTLRNMVTSYCGYYLPDGSVGITGICGKSFPIKASYASDGRRAA